MENLKKNKKSIIKTLSYSDVFSYPLSRVEIVKFYIGGKIPESQINDTLEDMIKAKEIEKNGQYYFLLGRRNIVNLRRKRAAISRRKLSKGARIAKTLSVIPSVRFIGISGSLSMKNADLADDIDLFIITSPGLLWTTRLLVNLVLIVGGHKRSRVDSLGIDKICPNMFVSQKTLKVDENMFTAHEVAQLSPLVVKKGSYDAFLSANEWVLKYLPNSFEKTNVTSEYSPMRFLSLIDRFLYMLQYKYMKSKITSEDVSEDRVKFHPKDKTYYVLELYKRKYRDYVKFLANRTKSFNSDTVLASSDTPGY